ncbi:uncharacterized protein N7484_006484 [Penicillium longicatenatum]|uniref:uncharacterized protein n=1 Tax=Penicillium longicatenatum TaxID=1561947 RepID=UPI0025468FE5|nr:uncharacterized protein N7484_006484 [Penicillium longicatenatum]KAJ5643977.1 hypothetical protein N7484_006484 [Penicillium longicatenatum]
MSLLTLNQHYQQTDAGDPTDSSDLLSSNQPSLLSSCSESSSEIALAQVVSRMESSSRELPPPSALPRMPAAMHTPLPPPPSHWQGTEPMQQWLRAKAEEDRRSQEEEKTRQETLRLEQRKIEQKILADSLRAGVPPHLIPLIFAGINGGNGGNSHCSETINQYMTHAYASRGFSTAPPPSQQSFSGSAANSFGPSVHLSVSQSSTATEHQRGVSTNSGAGLYPYPAVVNAGVPSPAGNNSARPPANTPVPPPLPAQPRAVDMQPQGMPNLASPHMPPHPPQIIPTSGRQDPRSSRPPPISFHHWVPPGQPQPPSQPLLQAPPNKGQTADPALASDPVSHAQDITGQNSPNRKRKSQNTHAPVAPPSARLFESAQRAIRSGAQSPGTGRPDQNEQRQSEVSHEFLTEAGPIGRRLSTPQTSPRSRIGSVWNSQQNSRSRSPERDIQHPPPSQNQAETSDMDVSSEQEMGSGDPTGNKP